MPNIPTSGLPDVGVNPLKLPERHLNYEGTFNEDIAEGISSVAKGADAMYGSFKKKYDDAKINDLEISTADWEWAHFDDEGSPDAGKSKKGEKFGPEDADKILRDYNDYTNELLSQTTTNEQHRRFQKIVDRRRQALRERITTHEVNQVESVAKEKYEGSLKMFIRDGTNTFGDERPNGLRAQALEAGHDSIDARARTEGWPAEMIAQEKMNFDTRFHSQIIDKYIPINPIRAQEYLDAHAKEIDPDKLDDLRRLVAGPVLMAKARVIASDIQAEAGPKEYAKQVQIAKQRLDTGKLNPNEYDETLKWLDRDKDAVVQAEDKIDSDNLDIMLNEVRYRYMNGTKVLLSENEDKFVKLSPGSQGKVRALVMEMMARDSTQARSAGAEERNSSRLALQEFRSRPVREKAEYKKIEDIDRDYLGVADEPTRKIMFSLARDAQETVRRGQEVSDDDFNRIVRATALDIPALVDDKERREDFISKMILWRAQWRKDNDFRDPRQKEIDEQMARALVYGDKGGMHLSRNKYGFEVGPDEDFVPFPEEDQEYLPNKVQLPQIDMSRTPMGMLRTKQPQQPQQSKAEQPRKPYVVKPGYTLVTDGTNFAQVPDKVVDQTLKENPDWRKAE